MKNLYRQLSIWFVVALLLGCCTHLQAQINEGNQAKISEYESHKLGGSGFPFHGATTFKGIVYGVQIYNSSRGSIRLVPFKENPSTKILEFDGSVDITSGGVYQDAETIVWGEKLVVFWKNNTNGNIYLKSSSDAKSFSGEKLVDDGRTYLNFAVVTYKEKLCLLYHNRDDDKIHIKYTADLDLNNAKWKYYGTVKNGSQNNIRFDGSSSISPNHVGSYVEDAWDAETWIGNNSKGKSSEMLVVGRVKKNGDFEAFTYEGNLNENTNDNWNWLITKNGACPNPFYLKLIQASIKGKTTSDTLPMQFIYATSESRTSGEIFFKEFLPASQSFSNNPQLYCDMPYGYFGVTTSNVLLENHMSNSTDPHYLYRQKLHLIRGNGPTYHFCDNHALSVSSNIIKASNQKLSNSTMLFSNSKLRSLITFEGVIEGPPPTVVENNEWYKNLGFGYYASTISIEQSEEETKSEKWGGGIDAKVKIGPKTKTMTARFQAELKLAGYDETAIKRKTIYSYSDFASDTARLNATAFYSMPTIARYDFEIWNCDKTNGPITGINPMVQFKILDYTMVLIPISLREAPFNIADPSKLNNWNHRPCLVGAHNIPSHQRLSMSFTMNTGKQKKTLAEERTVTTSFNASFDIGTDLDFSFFALDLMGGFNYEYTTQNTIGKNLSYTLNMIPSSTVPTGVIPVNNYKLDMYVLTHEESDLLEKFYYPAFKNKTLSYGNYRFPMLIEGEKPFVIAWNIDTSPFRVIPTGNEQRISTQVARAYTSTGMITVKALPGTKVSIYTLQGVLIHAETMNSDQLTVRAKSQIYIVEMKRENRTEVNKIAVP